MCTETSLALIVATEKARPQHQNLLKRQSESPNESMKTENSPREEPAWQDTSCLQTKGLGGGTQPMDRQATMGREGSGQPGLVWALAIP